MGDWSVHGPIRSMSNGELRRAIERTIERAADARKYGGPGYAKMYEDSLRDLFRESARRETAR